MLLLLLKVVGWVIARMPEGVLRGLCAVIGDLFFTLARARRRLVLSNLHHAFPERSEAWRERIGRESCRRMIETGLLSLATPYLGESRIRQMASLSPELADAIRRRAEQPHPLIFATIHMALWESQTWMGLLSPVPIGEFGVIFRPLDNPAADAFVKSTRERYGMRLLSRKAGFSEALKILRANGTVGLLFDQNAGMQGALTLLFDRVCSTSELAGILGAKFGAEVRSLYPRRLGFWRVEFGSDLIQTDGTAEATTLALNRWLENALTSDENLCASWLWVHARWRNQDIPTRRLRLEAKRNLLAADVASRGLTAPPRRTRIWVRLPNWLGDVVMVLPLLRAIRQSRPDAELTVVAKPHFLPLLQSWGVADRVHPLPPKTRGYWRHFWQLRREYIDVWLLFTNSFRGDLEAWLSGTRQRFGIARTGKRRPLLSHRFHVPAGFDESREHQLTLWTQFLNHFGLAVPPDCSPLVLPAPRTEPAAIGLIPGSENNPGKRWPVAHWRVLIEALPHERFVLFGTANDRAITQQVAAGFSTDRVTDRAGTTTLPEFADALSRCRLLVTNDTGGMHLANALGVPLIALFGPTNPVRTGPVFGGPTRVLQPDGCSPLGGGVLASLEPRKVIDEVTSQLQVQR